MKKTSLIFASSIAAVINAIFVTAITISAELNAPLKNFLQGLSGHHWTSKSILSVTLYLIMFLLFYLAFQKIDQKLIKSAVILAIWSAVVGSFAILLFFTGHHLKWY